MTADLIARLIEAGTPATLVADVAMALGRAQGDQDALAARRERDAERQRQKRRADAASRDVTVRNVTSTDSADADPSLDKEGFPQTPFQEIKPIPGVCIPLARETDPISVPVSWRIALNLLAAASLQARISAERLNLAASTAVATWNAMAERAGLPAVKRLTGDRPARLRARLAEHGPDAFTEAIAAIERSAFCRGDSDRGWRADFDFLLQPKSFLRLIEGSYDRQPERNDRRSGSREGNRQIDGFTGALRIIAGT